MLRLFHTAIRGVLDTPGQKSYRETEKTLMAEIGATDAKALPKATTNNALSRIASKLKALGGTVK